MLQIGDLVQIDEQAEFRSDVQLSAYDDPARNEALLRSYMFSSTSRQDEPSATPSKSPVEVLEELVQVFSHQRLDNRMVVVANYGHGKSHLALALANYFGKAADSPESAIIMEKLNYALADRSKVDRYKAFKKSRGHFLVIRLRGDVRRSLREQFVLGLEQALEEHPETRGTKLPFWFDLAERFLQGLDGGHRQRADEYLAQYQMDVPLLLQAVQNREDSAHERCVDLFTRLHYDVPPAFGSRVAIKEAIAWTVKQFCGPGKPLGGILVLFDEFSLYVVNYAFHSAPGELQDLLNGVDDHRGQVAFLAFAQLDPITVARESYRERPHAQTQLESLLRELTRLQRKFALYSVLESVIDSYLIQEDEIWRQFATEQRVKGRLFHATDMVLQAFRKRYEDELRWTTEQVQETMTKGCFPLHPLTTALLCNLQLQEEAAHLGTARTVLGFVRQELERRRKLSALQDSGNPNINWVLPVELVDYFGQTLSSTAFAQYDRAKQTLGPEITLEQDHVLKAIFLQQIAGLLSRGSDQVELLAELAGLTEDAAKTLLRSLTDSQAILYNSYQRLYSFWSAGTDPHKLEKSLRQHLAERTVDWPLLVQASQDHLEPVAVDVEWGHNQDWAALSYFLTRPFFTVEQLQQMAPTFSYDPKRGVVEGPRGCVVWLLAQNQEDLDWFKQKAAQVIDEAFPGDWPLPIVAVIPALPSPELLDAWQRKRGLEEFTQAERKEAGLELYLMRLDLLKDMVVKELQRLKIGPDFVRLPRPSRTFLAPLAYRNVIGALHQATLSKVLSSLYNLAYRAAPPVFFTQYTLNSTKLKAAVIQVANLLRQNSPVVPSQLTGIARDLAKRILTERWLMLNKDGHIREPGNAHLKQAWALLDETFVAGKETAVRTALVPLFNPPYGFDYHTVTLLFCAWFGYRTYDLELTANGQRVGNGVLDEWLGRDPKDFVNQICHRHNATLQRRDRAQIDRQASEHIDKADTNLTQAEAQALLDWLQEYCRDTNSNQALLSQAKVTTARLQKALETASEYDRQASEIAATIAKKDEELAVLIRLQSKIAKLPPIENVQHSSETADKLRDRWLESVRDTVDRNCTAWENLTSTTQVELYRQRLRELRDQLQQAKLTGVPVSRVDRALRVLEENVRKLQIQAQERGIEAAITAMQPSASLQVLYDYRQQLQGMAGLSAQTQRIRDAKLSTIKQEIANLERLGRELPEAVERLDSLDATYEWHNRCMRSYERYHGTPYYQTLTESVERVRTLQAFFQELQSIQEAPFSTVEEARKLEGRLVKLAEEAGGQLGEKQRSLMEEAKSTFKSSLNERMDAAEKRLATLENQWQSGAAPATIKASLAQIPPFLMSKSADRLEQLRAAVQLKLDEDIIATIEERFRQIADPGRRQKCLERLGQVDRELKGTVS